MIDLKADHRGLRVMLGALGAVGKKLPPKASQAINRSLDSTRAEMVRLIRADYAVKAKEVRDRLFIVHATPERLEGRIVGRGKRGVPLLRFARTRRVPSTRRTKGGGYRPLVGIPVLIRRDRGRIPARGVFLATMGSGHVGAFKRFDQPRRGSNIGQRYIREVFGPSPIKLMTEERYFRRVEQYAAATLSAQLERTVGRVLKERGLA
ncbi:MAG: phage tail protein [Desulfofustis sp.]|jgi:hypothetical protein|nr:phage tail protein [Desulfofustis sp.]